MEFIYLVYLAVILVLGLILYVLAGKTRTPYPLILIALGVIISYLTFSNKPVMQFSNSFLTLFVTLLLIVVLFQVSSRFNPKNINFSKETLKMFFIFLFINAIIMTFAMVFLFNGNVSSIIIMAIVFSSIETVVFSKIKCIEFLHIEAVFSSPFVVLLAFLFYDFSRMVDFNTVSIIDLIPFVQEILIGLGVGFLLGIVVFKIMKNHKVTYFHEIGLIAVAILTYVITEALNGSGIFAVMMLGVFFGNSYVKEKSGIEEFSPTILRAVDIFVYVLLGLVVLIPLNIVFFLKALVVFIIYIVIRFLALQFSYKLSIREKIFMSLIPKGIVFASLLLIFSLMIPGIENIAGFMLEFLVISIIVGYFSEMFFKKYVDVEE